MGKKSLFLVISAGISGVLFYLIFSQNTWGQWTRLLSRIRTDLPFLKIMFGIMASEVAVRGPNS